jgi:hypothetical protein
MATMPAKAVEQSRHRLTYSKPHDPSKAGKCLSFITGLA